MRNRVLAVAALLAIGAVGALSAHASQAQTGPGGKQHRQPPQLTGPASSPAWPSQLPQQLTSTPIKHLVVIFQENVSFDHYFGTYPYAANPLGGAQFHAASRTRRR